MAKKNVFVQIGSKDKPARLSFPFLFEPQLDDKGKNPRFSANLIIPKDHPVIAEIEKAMVEVAKAKWGVDYEDELEILKSTNRVCLKDGKLRKKHDGYEGNMFITASNKSRPKVYDNKAREISEGDEGAPYGGCNVIATVDVWALDHKDPQIGKRIGASLRGVQFHSDNDAFGGGQVASADEFASLASGADDDTDFEDLL